MFVARNWVYLFYMAEFQSQLAVTKNKSWFTHAQTSKFWCQNLSVPLIWSLLFFLIVFFLNTLSLCNKIATENHDELLSSELKSIREKDLLIPIHMPGKLYHLNKFLWSVKLILLIVQTQVTCPTLELMERCQHYLKDTYSEWESGGLPRENGRAATKQSNVSGKRIVNIIYTRYSNHLDNC